MTILQKPNLKNLVIWFVVVVAVQSLCRVWLAETLWTAAHQAPLPLTISGRCPPSQQCYLIISFSVAPFSFPRIRVFSSESALRIRWPKYWIFSFSMGPSSEYSGLISFRIDWKTLKSLLQHHNSKHQFFSNQLSLWSNSHTHTWLLEKPELWLCGPFLAKWCLCFLIAV